MLIDLFYNCNLNFKGFSKMPKHIADPSLDCKKLNAHQKNFLEKTAEKIKEYQIKKKRERERNYRLNNAEKIKA